MGVKRTPHNQAHYRCWKLSEKHLILFEIRKVQSDLNKYFRNVVNLSVSKSTGQRVSQLVGWPVSQSGKYCIWFMLYFVVV